MADEFLGERRRALEDAFFAKQNQKLLEDMRSKREAETQKQALAATSGVRDDAVLDALVAADITPQTIVALSLVPLVAVAWADGRIDSRERSAVLDAADQAGLQRASVPRELVETWLEERPPSELLETWKTYIGALRESLDPVTYHALHTEILAFARRVAEAAGGLLRGKVSADEERVLAELDAAFS